MNETARIARDLAPVRRGGRRRLTFDNGRWEEYEAVFVQSTSGGEWDRILIARDDGTIAQLLVDLINAAAVADSLDAAWAEAEAALPKGQTMDLVLESHVDGGRYLAWTMRHSDTAVIRGTGDSPAAALHALAAELREHG